MRALQFVIAAAAFAVYLAVAAAALRGDLKIALASFAATHLVGFGAGSSEKVETLVDRTSGTAFGDLTSGGGLAASFDGTTNQSNANSSNNASSFGYVGKSYGAGKIYSKVVIYGPNDQGYQTGANASHTVKLYAKNGAPSSGTDGTQIGSITFTDTSNESAGRTITSTDQVNSYTHVWVYHDSTGAGAGGIGHAELEIYELL